MPFNATPAKMTSAKIGLMLVCVPLAFQLASLAVFHQLLLRGHDELRQLEQEQINIARMHELGLLAGEAVLPMLQLNRDSQHASLQALDQVQSELIESLSFAERAHDVSPEFKRVIQSGRSLQHQIELMARKFSDFLSNPQITADDFRRKNRAFFFSIVMSFDELSMAILSEEHRVKFQTPEELHRLRIRFGLAILAVALLSVLISVVVAYAYSKGLVNALESLWKNLSRIASGLEPQPIETSQMEIERINQGLRQAFVALTEHRLHQLAVVNNSGDVACSLDRSLKFGSVAESCSRNWHYRPDDLLGRSLLTLVASPPKEAITAQFEKVAANGGGGTERLKIEMNCGDGVVRFLELSVSWSVDDKLFFVVARDVSEAEKFERLKSRFISVVSHDMTAPLTVVRGSLILILESRQGAINDKLRSELVKMEADVAQLTQFAGDVLLLHKLEYGGVALNMQEARLFNVCAAAVEAVTSLAKRAKVRFILPTSDALVIGDEQRLVQLLANLLSHVILQTVQDSQVVLEIDDAGEEAEVSLIAVLKVPDAGSAIEVPSKSCQIHLAIAQLIAGAHASQIVLSKIADGGPSRFSFRLAQVSEDDDDSTASHPMELE